jgi:hypothetical protein
MMKRLRRAGISPVALVAAPEMEIINAFKDDLEYV